MQEECLSVCLTACMHNLSRSNCTHVLGCSALSKPTRRYIGVDGSLAADDVVKLSVSSRCIPTISLHVDVNADLLPSRVPAFQDYTVSPDTEALPAATAHHTTACTGVDNACARCCSSCTDDALHDMHHAMFQLCHPVICDCVHAAVSERQAGAFPR